MSSEIGSQGSKPTARDMQDAYDRKKAELKESHEQQLKNIESNYRKQQAEAAEAGQASVNHIKKSTRSQVAQLDDVVREKSEVTQERIRALNDQQNQAAKRVDRNQSELVRQQANRKQEIIHEVQTDIQQAQEVGTKKLQETKARNFNEQKKIETVHKDRTTRLQSEYKNTYDNMRKTGQTRTEQLKDEYQQKLEAERKNYNSQSDSLRKRYQEEAQKSQVEGETKLSQVRERQQSQIKQSVEIGTKTNEKVHTQYERENQRLITTGEQTLGEREQINNQKLNEQKAEFEVETTETKARNEAQLKQQQAAYEKQKKIDASVQRQNLTQLKTDFLERQQKLGESHETNIEIQDKLYHRELHKQQQKYQARFDKIESRKEDPFYQGLNFGATVEETDSAYLFKAKVPSHEIENIDVRVKDDKVTISNHRKFEDRKELGDQVATTNSYQTQRQEFKLAIPVDAKGISRDRDAEGNITVKIPKKGMPQV